MYACKESQRAVKVCERGRGVEEEETYLPGKAAEARLVAAHDAPLRPQLSGRETAPCNKRAVRCETGAARPGPARRASLVLTRVAAHRTVVGEWLQGELALLGRASGALAAREQEASAGAVQQPRAHPARQEELARARRAGAPLPGLCTHTRAMSRRVHTLLKKYQLLPK